MEKKRGGNTYTKSSFSAVHVFLVFQMMFVKLHLEDAMGEVPYSGFIQVSL